MMHPDVGSQAENGLEAGQGLAVDHRTLQLIALAGPFCWQGLHVYGAVRPQRTSPTRKIMQTIRLCAPHKAPGNR